MNATPHTVLGYSTLKLVGLNPIGCLLAVASHLLADYVNETNGITTTKERVIYDILPTMLLLLISYSFIGWSEVLIVLLASILGNLPDLIDKKLYLSIIFPKKYKATRYLHWQKPIINPKPIVTKWLGYGMVLIISLILIIS